MAIKEGNGDYQERKNLIFGNNGQRERVRQRQRERKYSLRLTESKSKNLELDKFNVTVYK